MKKKLANTHLTLESRMVIENLLNEGKNLTQIANELQRNRSNIGKEISKHRTIVLPSSFNNNHVCNKKDCLLKSFDCYKTCKNLEISLCEKLISSPHVCNGCTTRNHCRHAKYYYNALNANNEYRNNWFNDRKGLHYSEEELSILNNDFKNLVISCKSLYHAIIVINKRGFNFKISTIYKQIEEKVKKIKKIELIKMIILKDILMKITHFIKKKIQRITKSKLIQWKV